MTAEKRSGQRVIKLLAIIESPLRGDVKRNVAYAMESMVDSIGRGEAPIASHLLYTLMLSDTVPECREIGMESGLAWGQVADLTAVYTDLGITPGMNYGIKRARSEKRHVEFRKIPDFEARVEVRLQRISRLSLADLYEEMYNDGLKHDQRLR